MSYGVEKIRQRQDGRGRGAPVGRRSLKGALLELVLERDAADLRDVVLPVLAQEERGPVCQLAWRSSRTSSEARSPSTA